MPDGLTVDDRGNLFATGGQGVALISPNGSHLGTIHAGEFVANVVLGSDGHLYMAAVDKIKRIRVTTKALEW